MLLLLLLFMVLQFLNVDTRQDIAKWSTVFIRIFDVLLHKKIKLFISKPLYPDNLHNLRYSEILPAMVGGGGRIFGPDPENKVIVNGLI